MVDSSSPSPTTSATPSVVSSPASAPTAATTPTTTTDPTTGPTARPTSTPISTPTSTPTATPRPTPPPLNITSLPFTAGDVGLAYAPVTLGAAGGTPPYSWSINSGALPSGLGQTGNTVQGTPNGSAATSTFTVQVMDAAGAVAQAVSSITINPDAFSRWKRLLQVLQCRAVLLHLWSFRQSKRRHGAIPVQPEWHASAWHKPEWALAGWGIPDCLLQPERHLVHGYRNGRPGRVREPSQWSLPGIPTHLHRKCHIQRKGGHRVHVADGLFRRCRNADYRPTGGYASRYSSFGVATRGHYFHAGAALGGKLQVRADAHGSGRLRTWCGPALLYTSDGGDHGRLINWRRRPP